MRIKVNDDSIKHNNESSIVILSSSKAGHESQLSANYQRKETSPSKKRITGKSPLNLDLHQVHNKIAGNRIVLEKAAKPSPGRKASVLTIEADLPSAHEIINNHPCFPS